MKLPLSQAIVFRLSLSHAPIVGTNPKDIADQIEASELTLGQIWDQYAAHLSSRAQPAKPNSMVSLAKARQKCKDWDDRKIRLIGSSEVTTGA